MSLLVSLLIWAAIAIVLICIAMGNRNYDAMLDEVNRRLPEGQKIKRPFFSCKWHAIVSLHEQLYPESPTRREQRLLIRVLLITFVSLAFISIAWVLSKGPVQR
jgi:hypothetical protein